ncbi:hypothetical protein H650_24190 [Enterobacter sp. R4-368]|nr:hypothetical protein H650_24190 [Enterobacter sp. R4-368]
MLAIICCMVVANIYFNQSVLNLIAATFPHEWAAVSLIPMATQLGYAAGLFLLISLGDYIERQRLILRQAQVLLLALIGMMLAHRYGYGAGVTGTLAALGLIGILCAPLAGSFSDRQGPFRMVVLGVLLMLFAWGALWAWNSMAGLVVGILLLDAGEQCVLIANQHTIYALRPDARNRLNTLFMSIMFLGGAGGSLAAAWVWEITHSWALISSAGAGLVMMGMLMAVRRQPGASFLAGKTLKLSGLMPLVISMYDFTSISAAYLFRRVSDCGVLRKKAVWTHRGSTLHLRSWGNGFYDYHDIHSEIHTDAKHL